MSKLDNGCIPAGQACPFLDQCRMRMDHCPTTENPRPVPFSCAAARMIDMIDEHELPRDGLMGKIALRENAEPLVKDLFGRLHRAVEIRPAGGLDEARLFCTEREPKSEYGKLYPWHRIAGKPIYDVFRHDGEKCSACFPSEDDPSYRVKS